MATRSRPLSTSTSPPAPKTSITETGPEENQDKPQADALTAEVKKIYTSKIPSFKTPKLSELVKGEVKQQNASVVQVEKTEDKPFSEEQLQTIWNEFTEKRKAYQAEYHVLTQPFILEGTKITVHVHPVEESLFNSLKGDLATLLREQLKNNSITIVSELKLETDKKVIYTSREKFDYLMEKNPVLKELKDRLGLDPDF